MAFEAFANAISRVSEDYARTREEQRLYDRTRADEERLHNRARQEKVADRDDERAYQEKRDKQSEERQIRLAKEQANISFELWQRQNEAQRLDRLRDLGIDGRSMSPAEQFAKAREASLKILAEDTTAKANAQLDAEQAIANKRRFDPNFAINAAQDQANIETAQAKQIIAAKADIQTAQAQINDLLKSDPAAGQLQDLPTLAAQKAQQFLSTATPEAILKSAEDMGLKTKDVSKARAAIMANPVNWATMTQGLTEAVVKANNAVVMANMKAAGYEQHPMVQSLLARISENVRFLRDRGVVAYDPVTPAAAPAGSAIAPNAPSASGPAFRPPGTAPVSATTPRMGGAGGNWGPPVFRDLSANDPLPNLPVAKPPPAPALPPSTSTFWRNFQSAPSAPPRPAPVAPQAGVGEQAPGTAATFFASAQPIERQRAAAESWLNSNAQGLPPDTKNALISEYLGVINTNLPVEEKTRRVQELQTRALSLPRIGNDAGVSMPRPTFWGR